MEIGNIIKGHVNEVLNKNGDISKQRMQICLECPIYSTRFGGQCNGKLYLNPKTNDISLERKQGYFKGCNCRLNAKTRIKAEKCPAGKW